MPQSSIFPVRYGLSVNRGENLQATEVLCEGGLDLTQGTIETRPGFASSLVNFEVSMVGGYRRINGFAKYSATVVPGQGQILGVVVNIPGYILAARQDASDATKINIYSGTGTTWTQLNPSTTTATGTTNNTTTISGIASTVGLCIGQPVSGTGIPANTRIATIPGSNSITITNAATNAATETITFTNPLTYGSGMIVNSCFYNWSGTHTQVFTDGVNPAYQWDGTTFTVLAGTGSANNPKYCAEFAGYLFVSGYSTNNGAIKISAPLNAQDWQPLDGAAEIVVGDTISWMQEWRQQLIVFCKTTINRIVGNSTNAFSPQPFTNQTITHKIGCLEGRTVKELNGDLIFLAPDGIRTISGTFKIGDTEIASISRPIQAIVSTINPVTTPCHSVVVAKRTQYRLFYPTASLDEQAAPGIVGGIRRFRDGHEDWEWGQLLGIKPACCANGYMVDDNEYTMHGGYDGFIYRQNIGGTFNGAAINEIYQTVPLEFGDRGVRKVLHRLTAYVTSDTGAPNLNLGITYDLNKPHTVNPSTLAMANQGSTGTAVMWDDGSLWDAGGSVVWRIGGTPYYRQNIQGSGFVAQLRFNSTNTSVSYVIQGFLLEYYPAGRR